MSASGATRSPLGLTNWARNVTFAPARFHRPTSVPELRELVAGVEHVRVRDGSLVQPDRRHGR